MTFRRQAILYWPKSILTSSFKRGKCRGRRHGRTHRSTARFNVDGENTELGDGKSLSTPDGVDVWRRGNVYIITSQSGDSVRAEVNASWINVSVGFGHSPAKVRGLLANADGNVNQIATRDGTVLTNPFSFEELYHPYADSWRVASNESLLSVCGDRNVE